MNRVMQNVFEVVTRRLPEAGIDFLMIGGHAVNYYGFIRATMDVDFMIAASDQHAVRRIMTEAGFTNISTAENVTFFSQPDSSLRVDFLSVDLDTLRQLLDRAVQVPYLAVSVTVPCLEDLISMKLFALHNGSPKRASRDSEDIVRLVIEHDLDLETTLKPLCLRFADEAEYRALKERIEQERHG